MFSSIERGGCFGRAGLFGSGATRPAAAAERRNVRELAAPQPGSGRQPILRAGPDQHVEREAARPTLALPARCHRRRQQPDNARDCRRNAVRDRFPRERVRGRRRRRTSSLELRCHAVDWRGSERRLRIPQPRRLLCEWGDLRGGRLISARTRRKNREADAGLRQERPCARDPGRAKREIPGRDVAHHARVLVHHGAAGVRRRPLHRQHAKREPHSRRPCNRRRRENGQGALALQHHSAGRKRSGLGGCRSDLGGR